MNLLLSMSLAGSLVFLVYLILKPLAVRFFSSAWRYRLLKFSLVFYLLPYQYYKFRYYGILYPVLFHRQYESPEYQNGIVSYDMDALIYIDADGNYSIKNQKIIIAVLAVWFIAVLSFVVYQMVKYISCRKILRQISDTPDPDTNMILEQCREKVHVKKRVKLYCSPYMKTPFTIGAFSPYIVLPETLKKEKSFCMAVTHELIHIRNHDILIKFFALFVLVLHWYNPLTYLLYWEICKTGEHACDEAVIWGMSEEEKEFYKLLILNTAEKTSHVNTIFSNALSSHFKLLEERMKLMERSIISPKCMHIVSFAVAILLLAMSPLPVMAYDPWEIGISKNPDDTFDFETVREVYVVVDGTSFDLMDEYDPFLELGTDQEFFVGDDGVPRVMHETENQTERSSCNHIWQNGKSYQHIANNDGSCIVNIYETKTCSRCGVYEIGDLYNSMHYPKCPH